MTERKTPLQVLKEARKLIAEPERWTQKVYARTTRGRETSSLSRYAVSWCLTGALIRAAGRDNEARWGAGRALNAILPDGRITFNDAPGRTHPEVLAALDKAIASLEQQP